MNAIGIGAMGLAAVAIWGCLARSIYYDWNPTPAMIHEQKILNICKTKCRPNFGAVIDGKCWCEDHWKDASRAGSHR